MYYTRQNVKDIMKAGFSELKPEYDRLAEKSWNEYVQTLPSHYSVVPERGKIYTDPAKDEFKQFVANKRSYLTTVINERRKSINDTMAAPPTDEALRAITALKLRNPEHMSKEEYTDAIDRLMTRYGENYSVYMALYDIAVEAGIRDFKKHPLSYEAEELDELDRMISSNFDAHEIIYGEAISPTAVYMFNMAVDSVVPD